MNRSIERKETASRAWELNPRSPGRDRGTLLITTLLVLLLMAGLTTAFFVVAFAGSKQSVFYSGRDELRQYAEDGVSMAVMELNYGAGGGDGKIGTELWTTADDVGKDGKAGTGDEGEGDKIPTPGEPHLVSSAVGPISGGIGLLVHTEDSAWAGTKHVVSVAYNARSYVALEAYASHTPISMPSVGASYFPGSTAFQLSGNNYTINGNDTNPDGTPGPNPKNYAVTTPIGTPAGTNQTLLGAQLNPSGSSFTGLNGGAKGQASINEIADPQFESLFASYQNAQGVVNILGGDYTKSGLTIGDYTKKLNQVTYVKGDLLVASGFTGAGILLVDGNLKMSGQSIFVGLVMVRGNTELSGGGNGVHIYGTLMDQNPLPPTTVKLTGNSHVDYSSAGLKWVQGVLGKKVTVRFWNQLK
jgi:hypothetical protein